MTIEAQDEVNYAGKKVAAGRPCRRRLARGIMDRDRENEPRAIGDLRLWDAYCAAEAALINSRMRLAREAADLPAVVREALGGADRGPALRLLADSPVESSVPHLDRLVRLACVSHREIELSRLLVAKLHARGYRNEIARVVDDVLATGGGDEFRRVAELYAQIDPSSLRAHLDKCTQSSDSEVREVGADFADDVLVMR